MWYLTTPPFCSYCKTWIIDDVMLCNPCAANIQPVVSVTLAIRKTVRIPVYAISSYQDPLKKLLLRKIYSDIATIHQLARFMSANLLFDYHIFDYIVPIPSHWTRYAYRGFNQSHEFAKVIAEERGIILISALTRTKKTAYQSRLASACRTENLQNAFTLKAGMRQILKGKRILLVDDLMTTGSTIISAARTVYSAKPTQVSAYVTCRVI